MKEVPFQGEANCLHHAKPAVESDGVVPAWGTVCIVEEVQHPSQEERPDLTTLHG